MADKFQQLRQSLPGLEEKVLLKNYTTFGIGGPADFFYRAKSVLDLINAVKLCRRLGIDFFILGGGSKLLVSDDGFRGLVIKNQSSAIKVLKNNRIKVASGVTNQALVSFCREHGLTGTEFLVGIPGTVGGAIKYNARFRDPRSFLKYFVDFHAVKDRFMGDLVETVKLLLPDGRVVTRGRRYCQFDYHTSGLRSVFQKKDDIILEAVLKLDKADPDQIDRAIKKISLWRLTRKVGKKARNPDPFTGGLNPQPRGKSAGCIFSNTPNKWNHPAGRMIDLCGLKGTRVGGAKISEAHANFIINDNNATAQDVIQLIKIIKKAVKEKFDVELEEEIQYIGF